MDKMIFSCSMRYRVVILFLVIILIPCRAQVVLFKSRPAPGYEERIKGYIDTMRIFDTHEHFFDPDLLKKADFFDFTMLLQQNSYDDLISAGMPDSGLAILYNDSLTPSSKWKIIEPYWNKTLNTTYIRILLLAINDLYGISNLNSSSVELLSQKMKNNYNGDWFNHVLKDICRIDYVIQSGDSITKNTGFIKHATKFGSWLTIRSKFGIDSLAVVQVDPIYTLDDFVRSMKTAFDIALKNGMAAVKINFAYLRSLNIENVSVEAARKVFRTLVNGNEDLVISFRDAKPLQDYMVHQLLNMSRKAGIPVAFHTGLQAGTGNYINNSNPALLSNIFKEYPDINFVLFHGSYPFGGELSTLAKTYKNVYIDMNWTYAISPAFTARYLNEWLETVPASKIMAFGGDQRYVEITYGNLVVAKQLISNVLIEKVKNGYLTESEAITVARMILHDNGMKFYKIH